MSEPNLLLGYISETLPTYQPDQNFFRRANDVVLAALPTDDEWPRLYRSLFSVTGDDTQHGSFRGQRLIHFAGQFNGLINDLDPWLDKFERLLRQLYWLEAEIFLMNASSGPPLVLKYQVSAETVMQYAESSPKTPQTWTLRAHRLKVIPEEAKTLAKFIGSHRVLATPNA